jgi:subtilisin
MRRHVLLVLPLLFMAACDGAPGPMAPQDDVAAFGRPDDLLNVIVVLQGTVAPGDRAANRERAASVARGLGLEPGHTYGAALFGFSATVTARRLEELRRSPLVAAVELDRAVSLPEPVLEVRPGGTAAGGEATETSSGTQVVPWGVGRVGALENGSTGSGVHVYVLDTGIDPDHPDLQGALGEGHTVFTTSCRGNPRNCPPPPTWHDDHGHGTHVAGTVGARDNGSGVIGVAPGVTLHAVKVLGETGSGSRSGVIAGVDWVTGHNPDVPRVANMSITGTGQKLGSCTAEGPSGDADAYHIAICNARNAGVVVVVAAGNTGEDAAVQVPAAYYDAAITVSATSCRFDAALQVCETGSERFTFFSSWGTGQDDAWPSEGSLPVVIAAPGASVLSTSLGGGHHHASGTSMASPHVAGGAALLLEPLLGSQPPDGSAFTVIRAALLGASECTATWYKVGGNPHAERFLNLRSPEPIDECVEPGDPPPAAPTDLRVVQTTSSSVTLEWDHAEPTGARFEIWQYTTVWAHLTYVDGVTSHTVDGLLPATTYRYAVRTVNDVEASTWSEIVTVTTLPEEEPEFTAALSYSCDWDRCNFAADHRMSYAHYDWVVEDGAPRSGTGLWNITTYFSEAKTYTATLTITVGEQVETGSATVTCAFRGRNLRCE